jgi:PAS domain S-box-containing protein
MGLPQFELSDESETLLSRRAAGRLAGLLYVGSGLVVIASVPLPQPPGANRLALLALACGAVLLGSLAFIAPWERWRRATSLVVVPPAFGLIATANAVGGFPFFSYGIFFVVVFAWIGICHRPLVATAFAPLAAFAYVVPVLLIGRQVAAGVSSAIPVIPVCVLVGESLSWVANRYSRGRQQAQESQQQYATLVDLLPDAILVHRDYRLAYVNPAAMKLLGADNPEELIGRSVLDVVHPDYWDIVRRRVRQEIEDGRLAPLIEERFVRLDGTLIDVEVAGDAITYQGGPAGLVVVRDITDRKRADAALEQSLQALRRIDGERRRLLAHLVDAQEDERRRLADDIHDDTIQIMTAAAMRLDLLQRKLGPSHQEFLDRTTETVHRALDRLRHLIFELHPDVLDRGGLAQAIGAYLADAEWADQAVSVHLENRMRNEPRPDVRTVAYRIVQEALANARKHARATKVDVRLESVQGGLQVGVRDDGVGFSTQEVSHSRPGHLGLTTMRERAEMAGGWCTITSTPGEGTQVEFWLPTTDDVNSLKAGVNVS